jgi:hypothetical protein
MRRSRGVSLPDCEASQLAGRPPCRANKPDVRSLALVVSHTEGSLTAVVRCGGGVVVTGGVSPQVVVAAMLRQHAGTPAHRASPQPSQPHRGFSRHHGDRRERAASIESLTPLVSRQSPSGACRSHLCS